MIDKVTVKRIEFIGTRVVWGAMSVFCVSVLFFLLCFIHTSDDLALRFSAINGYPRFVKTLITFGANVHADNDEALRLAAWQGQTAIVEILLDHGANVHAANDETLWLSAKQGRTELVAILLDHGADIHAKKELALHAAVDAGQIQTVRLLLDRGADAAGCNGSAILQTAEQRGYREIADVIRKQMLFTNHSDKAIACSAEQLMQDTPQQHDPVR
jgi:hypothetical protein